MSKNYQLLISKLDRFTRKFYLNKLLRGGLYLIGSILLIFLIINLLEHQFYFSSTIRKVLFFGFIAGSATLIFHWIGKPLLQLFHIRKGLNQEQAARIIGDHFADVQDKLLNLLQLEKIRQSAGDNDLLKASIDQKTDAIKPIPFASAIDLRRNRKYVKYALVPMCLLLFLLFAAPNLIKDPSNRLINNNKHYEKQAPFIFNVINESLEAVQFDDVSIQIAVDGEVLPSEAFINLEGQVFKLNKEQTDHYSYQINNIQKSTSFFISAEGFDSKVYEIHVVPKPMVMDFDIFLHYPNYIERQDETLSNLGDLHIPVGTEVKWEIKTNNTESVDIQWNNELLPFNITANNRYEYQKRALSNHQYKIYISNKFLPKADSVAYAIQVIPDQYPAISAQEFIDSLSNEVVYFLGESSDDYGIKKVHFKYQITRKNLQLPEQSESIILSGSKTTGTFTHNLDFVKLGLLAGDKITYYFEVWDNDAVFGSKSSKTGLFQYEMASLKELEKEVEQTNEEIKDELEETMKDAKELKEDIEEFKKQSIEKKELGWEERQKLESLINRQKNLQNQIQDVSRKSKENFNKQSEYKKVNEEILKKQEKLQELMDNIMNEEMKKLLEELEQLLEELNKEDALEKLDEMEMNDEELEKALDRMLELFKKLELEQKMEETIEELNKLAEEEEKLGDQSEKNEKTAEEMKKEQEEIEKKFEEIKEDLDEMEKLKEEAKEPLDVEDFKKDAEEISEEMEKSEEEMEKGEMQKAGKKQKSASQKMKKMAKKMQSSLSDMQMEQMQMDMESLRQLLENLVDLSFNQEDLIDRSKEVGINDPSYVPLIQEQFKLKDDFNMVEDSLAALAKRVVEIESFVTEQVADIKRNLNQSLDNLEERRKGPATADQQFVMTGMNNLALMLSEVMEQMQQQMSSLMPGSQQCNKPGNGMGEGRKPNMQGLKKMQEQLNSQLKDMMKGMKEGKGQQGQMSKQAAEAAARQAAIRERLQEMQNDMIKGKEGKSGELGEMIKQMDETEEDLYNKQLTQEMLMRQEEILDKLLKAEKADREKELDELRKSATAQQKARQVPPEIEEYLKKRSSEVDFYKTVPPSLRPYYKNLVEKYFKDLNYN